MSNVALSPRPRRLLLAALVLVAAVATGLATAHPAAAVIIAGPGVCTYYSDATYTTVVGHRSNGCCGGTTTTGTVTPYVRCERVYCPAVVCPQVD